MCLKIKHLIRVGVVIGVSLLLLCWFAEDDGLPKVPPLKITLTPSYPDSCPEVDMKEYASK